jgi:ASC-1-like (ASCH) protein
MQTHNMKLYAAPFASIRAKTKTVEMRLYDEKRQALQVGDLLRFTNADTGETLLTEIIALHVYPTFDELYERFEKTTLGYMENETANPKDMLAYYSQENIEKYGVVGIELRLK